MARFCRRLRRLRYLVYLATRVAFAAAAAFALVSSADAQWFPPFGAAPPPEIVQRLRAEGYVLIRPLERRDTVYLADVVGGPGGRERLVIDAWSGEILQRFVARRGGLVPEGDEFHEPPPLGPPPARDFREGNFGAGQEVPPGGFEAPPRAKVRSRPATAARRSSEPKPTMPAAQPVEPRNAGNANPGAAPAATAPAGAAGPATAASPPAAAASPNAAEPKPEAAAAAQSRARNAAAPPSSPAPPSPPPASAEKPGEKKVNDVPVNPLD